MQTFLERLFPKKSKYLKLIRKSHTQVDKELDLQKFIHRSRTNVTALLGLLTSKQSFFVDKMGPIVIHESSDMTQTSDDDELDSNLLKDMNTYARDMVYSKDKTD